MHRRTFLTKSLSMTGAGTLALERASLYASSNSSSSPRINSSLTTSTSTILFFDDWPLNLLDHIVRRIGSSERISDCTFVDPYLNVTWGYPSVLRNQQSGGWHCFYQGWDHKRERLFPLLAESKDGIVWRPSVEVSKINLVSGERTYPHQVLPIDEFSEWNPCFYDEHADRAERIKGLVISHGKGRSKAHLWVSPDGLRWQRREGSEWQRPAPDPLTSVFWNSLRSSYVLTTRPDASDRRISLVETKDWRTFSEPVLAIQADPLDTHLAETYGMPVFPYEGYYLGFLWIYHVSQEVANQSPHKFWRGKIDSQLVYSRNGWHFQRGLREAFLPNAEPGEYGAGCLQPASLVIGEKDNLRIYSSATKFEHGVPTPGDGAIIMHRLRRDGFVYLQPEGGAGVIGTRALLWKGGELKINTQATGGAVRVQITDSRGAPLPGYTFEECVPFTGDALYYQPRWREGRYGVAELPERTLRIEVRLENARLYAIRGNISILTGTETYRYESLGEKIPPRPGF